MASDGSIEFRTAGGLKDGNIVDLVAMGEGIKERKRYILNWILAAIGL